MGKVTMGGQERGQAMFNQNTRLSVSFSEAEKEGMLRVLKFFDAYGIAEDLAEIIKVPGDTVLTAGQALILAGLIRQWYSFLADRLTYHPAIWEIKNRQSKLAGGDDGER